jgi:hypothetical protein
VAIIIEVFQDENFLFATQGVLSKDHTVWLDGARPAKHLYPNLLPRECTCAAAQLTRKQKYVCEYIKMDVCESKRKNPNLTSTLSK